MREICSDYNHMPVTVLSFSRAFLRGAGIFIFKFRPLLFGRCEAVGWVSRRVGSEMEIACRKPSRAHSEGKGRKGCRMDRRKSQAAEKASADLTGGSEAGKALWHYLLHRTSRGLSAPSTHWRQAPPERRNGFG